MACKRIEKIYHMDPRMDIPPPGCVPPFLSGDAGIRLVGEFVSGVLFF